MVNRQWQKHIILSILQWFQTYLNHLYVNKIFAVSIKYQIKDMKSIHIFSSMLIVLPLFKNRSWIVDSFYLKNNFHYVISMACWNDTLNLDFFCKKINGFNLNRITLLSSLVFLNAGLEKIVRPYFIKIMFIITHLNL